MNATPEIQALLDAVRNPDAGQLPPDTLEALRRQAPWLALPDVLELQRNADLTSERHRELEARVALLLPGAEAMTMLTDRDAELWQSFYPADETPSRPDTDDAISTFLDTYGKGPSAEDDALLERLIFNPQPDYASVLEEQYAGEASGEVPDEHTAMIDAFLANVGPTGRTAEAPAPAEPPAPAPEPAPPVTPQPPAPPGAADAPLGESLAKIYIRQRRYDKAYEIISNLNLNFPEKSAYFADQLRFLKKLMAASRLAGNRH